MVLSPQNERSTKLCVSWIVNSEKRRQLLSLGTVVYKCIGFGKIGRKLYVTAYTFSNTNQQIFFQLKKKVFCLIRKGYPFVRNSNSNCWTKEYFFVFGRFTPCTSVDGLRTATIFSFSTTSYYICRKDCYESHTQLGQHGQVASPQPWGRQDM